MTPEERTVAALERIATVLEALVPLVREIGDQLDTMPRGWGDRLERHAYLRYRVDSTQDLARDIERRYMEAPPSDQSLATAYADARAAYLEAADALRAYESAHAEAAQNGGA